jgi:hypothetical protein
VGGGHRGRGILERSYDISNSNTWTVQVGDLTEVDTSPSEP